MTISGQVRVIFLFVNFFPHYWFSVKLSDKPTGISLLSTVVCKIVENSVLRSKMPMFQRAGMKEGGLPLPPALQYLILMI